MRSPKSHSLTPGRGEGNEKGEVRVDGSLGRKVERYQKSPTSFLAPVLWPWTEPVNLLQIAVIIFPRELSPVIGFPRLFNGFLVLRWRFMKLLRSGCISSCRAASVVVMFPRGLALIKRSRRRVGLGS